MVPPVASCTFGVRASNPGHREAQARMDKWALRCGSRVDAMSHRQTPTLTPAMLAANRRNAQKATGPRTEEGKRRVRLNGLKHGLRCSFFRDSLIKSGESTALVDRNFLFCTFLLRPQKLYEVRRIAQLVHVLWSVTHWGRRHELRAGRPERLLKKAVTELHLEALLDAAGEAGEKVGAASHKWTGGPGLAISPGNRPRPIPKRAGTAPPDGSDLVAWVGASQAPREAPLDAQRMRKNLQPKPESNVESLTSILPGFPPSPRVDTGALPAGRCGGWGCTTGAGYGKPHPYNRPTWAPGKPTKMNDQSRNLTSNYQHRLLRRIPRSPRNR